MRASSASPSRTLPSGPNVGRVDGVEAAVAHRLVDQVEVARDAGRDQQDRAGAVGHDAARRLDAVHDRHDQVHEDHVGPVGRALRTASAPSSAIQATV